MPFVMNSLDKAPLALIVPAQHGPLSNTFHIFTLTMLHPEPVYVPIIKIEDGTESLVPL